MFLEWCKYVYSDVWEADLLYCRQQILCVSSSAAAVNKTITTLPVELTPTTITKGGLIIDAIEGELLVS